MTAVRVSEGPDSCEEHEWVTDERVTTSDDSHVVKVCRTCSAIALTGPDES